jgi:glycosyltransferase involved in cell wall biosynthesis
MCPRQCARRVRNLRQDLMKVAFVITGLATGGAEMMLYKLLAHSPALRKGCVLPLRCGGELEEPIRRLGVAVECLGMKPGVPHLLAISRLSRILRERKPDVVSSWMYHADLLAGVAGRLNRIPVVWGIRNSDFHPTKTKRMTHLVMRACARLSAYLPSKIVSCSAAARDIHVALGYKKERFTVIPNGFDIDQFHPSFEARASVRGELGLEADARIVALIARFDPQKNHLGFLDAAQKIYQRDPSVRFVMAGYGVNSDNEHLRIKVEERGLAQAAFMLGPRGDVPRLMAALDVLVVSSSYGEAFPNVVGEAMACEVPCVVTDVGDSASIVGDTGIAVARDDPSALADAVQRILELPSEAKDSLGKRARERVTERFDIRKVARSYEALFEETRVKRLISP